MANSEILNNDSADITVLEFPECVRLRKEMYLTNKTHAIYEIVDNAVDEHLAGFCNVIQVTIDANEHITVLDNGRGIPVDKHSDPRFAHLSQAEVALTVLHAGGKFKGKKGAYQTASAGLHGVGASCTNATSSAMTLTVYKNQKIYQAQFSRGLIVDHLKEVGAYEEAFSGTQVEFDLDPEIWKEEEIEYGHLEKRLKQLAYLNPGLMLTYKCEKARHEKEENFYYPDGVRSYVDELAKNKNPLIETLYANSVIDEVNLQFSITYTEANSADTYSFCNNVHTEAGGDHLIGLHHGIAKAINDYAQDKKILKEGQKFEISDCLEGVVAVISIIVKEAAFEGQGKTKIKMSYVRPIVRNYVSETLFNYLDHNPSKAQAILDKVMLSQKARLAANKARESIRKQKGAVVGNPKGLAQCTETDPALCEIFIVEGDSAGGSAKDGRDRKTQAILPLFGKILNTEKSSDELVEDNAKLEELVKALKCGIGQDFDFSHLRYHKIIIMADGDVDGLHIKTLYLTYFYRYMPEIIKRNMLYMAVPPLYKLEYGKDKVHYAYSDAERDHIVQTEGSPEVIRHYKGLGEMAPDHLWETTMNPENRTLIQITIEDAEKAEEALSICMGKAVPPRRAFIEENALYAQIDV